MDDSCGNFCPVWRSWPPLWCPCPRLGAACSSLFNQAAAGMSSGPVVRNPRPQNAQVVVPQHPPNRLPPNLPPLVSFANPITMSSPRWTLGSRPNPPWLNPFPSGPSLQKASNQATSACLSVLNPRLPCGWPTAVFAVETPRAPWNFRFGVAQPCLHGL